MRSTRAALVVAAAIGPLAAVLTGACASLKSGSDRAADPGGDASGGAPSCTIAAPSDEMIVDDLSASEAGIYQLVAGAWISTTPETDRFFVVTQDAPPAVDFIAYQVDLAAGTSVTTMLGPGSPVLPGTTGLALLDVEPTATGSVALLAESTGPGSLPGPTGSVYLVPIPSDFGATAPVQQVAGALGTPQALGSGTLAAPGSAKSLWAIAFDELGGPALTIGAGEEADAARPQITWQGATASAQSAYTLRGASLMDVAGTILLFAPGQSGQGSTAFVAPDDFVDAGTQAPVGGGFVLAARPSTADPTRVLVFGVEASASADAGDGSTTVWSGAVTASQAAALAIGSPLLVQGGVVSPGELPLAGASHAWSGDDLALLGAPSDGSGGLELLWLASDGHVAGSGKVVTGAVKASGVQFGARNGESGATLYVTWIDSAPLAGGGSYDRVHAAKVTCGPVSAGGPGDGATDVTTDTSISGTATLE